MLGDYYGNLEVLSAMNPSGNTITFTHKDRSVTIPFDGVECGASVQAQQFV